MNCKEAGGLLFDYAENRLAPPSRGQVRAHLDTCARCAEAVHQWQEIYSLLGSGPRYLPPAALIERTVLEARSYAGIRRPRRPFKAFLPVAPQFGPRRGERVRHVAASAAAALILVLVAGVVFSSPAGALARLPLHPSGMAGADALRNVFGTLGSLVDRVFSLPLHWSALVTGLFY